MSNKKVADRDYYLEDDGDEVVNEPQEGYSVLVRKGEEVTAVMARDHGIEGVDEDDVQIDNSLPGGQGGQVDNTLPSGETPDNTLPESGAKPKY
jgi:hypothetical protein